ncbi:MAG: DUF433 domain-containing protein [Acidobacteriota bacterium]
MTNQDPILRIHSDPAVLAGKPVIRGTRLSVDFILGLLGRGASPEEILEEYEGLQLEDVRACLLFAARSIGSTSFLPLALDSA